MTRRLITSLLLLLAVITLPAFIYLPAIFAAVIVFPFFWESVLLGFLIDVLYGQGITPLPSLVSPFALGALVLVMLMVPVRKRLRSYV